MAQQASRIVVELPIGSGKPIRIEIIGTLAVLMAIFIPASGFLIGRAVGWW